MFSESKKSKNRANKNPDFSKEQNKIAKGTKMVGNIESVGAFRIDGTLEGNLTTKGKIVIGETGVVKGDITCGSADIEGKIEGSLVVQSTLSLKSTCIIEADVTTEKLIVEPGAILNGTCTMRKELKMINNEQQKGGGRQIEKKGQSA